MQEKIINVLILTTLSVHDLTLENQVINLKYLSRIWSDHPKAEAMLYGIINAQKHAIHHQKNITLNEVRQSC